MQGRVGDGLEIYSWKLNQMEWADLLTDTRPQANQSTNIDEEVLPPELFKGIPFKSLTKNNFTGRWSISHIILTFFS